MIKELIKVVDDAVADEIDKDHHPKKKLRKFVSPEKKRAQRRKELRDNEITAFILFAGCAVWFVYLIVKLVKSF